VKTIALYLAVLAAAGHLISLQNQSRKHSKAILWQLAWFVAVPTYPIATLIDRVFRCANIIRQKGRQSVSLSYCLNRILGMHAEKRLAIGQDSVDSIPLLEARPEDVRSVSQKRDWFWTGRIIILMGLMTQSVATLVLSNRRLNAGHLGEIDIRNAMMAFGGLVVQLISACILLRSERWELIPGTIPPNAPTQPASGKNLGIIASLFIIVSTIVNSWYFRFHIRDTYNQVRKKEDERLYNFPRALDISLSESDTNSYIVDTYLRQCSRSTVPRPSSEGTILRPSSGGTILPNVYWLVWLFILYPLHQTNQLLALLTSAFLSLSFVVEEMVLGNFPTWKDSLAEKLYVF
jgi:hypothetical protein